MAKRFPGLGHGYSLTAVLVGCAAWGSSGCAGSDLGGGDLSSTGGSGSGGESSGVGGSLSASGGSGAAGGDTATGGGGATESCTTPEAPGDACYLATGLAFDCKQRFALGINYAWHSFATDFGGLAVWSLPGVAANDAVYDTELADMKAHGVSTVRWWMYPDFRGDGVLFDASNDASGLGTTTVADIQKALELADKNDLYLVLTLFSFDNFRPDHDGDDGAATLLVRGMAPMIEDANRRAKLIENVVRPTAQAVAASPYAHRLLGWDIINEPEWVVAANTPGAPSGGAFAPNAEMTAVSLTSLKALINESAAALKEELPSGLTTVGWAAAKWSWAFTDMTSLDFHEPHIYEWVDQYWPYTTAPAALGYGSKPVVMGEFFLKAMPFDPSDTDSFETINESWFNSGYAGAWSWQYVENAADAGLIKTFADTKGCQAGF